MTDYAGLAATVRATRAQQARQLRNAGYTVRAIASALGVSVGTVINDLKEPQR